MQLFVIILLVIRSFTFSTSAQSEVKITVTNMKVNQGQVLIGLYNKAQNFPEEGKEYRTGKVKVNGPEAVYTFKNVPAGDYAIALLHDENSDGKCNYNLLGIPKEGYGFSNNVKHVLKAPSFSETKFKVTAGKSISINIELIN